MSDHILSKIENQPYVQIEESDLKNLLKRYKVYAEYNTLISDYIRILQIGDRIIVQERTISGEILLRKFKSLNTAQDFITQRMITYDKMWDGCGCKIDYYS